jgi:hypothetical protein
LYDVTHCQCRPDHILIASHITEARDKNGFNTTKTGGAVDHFQGKSIMKHLPYSPRLIKEIRPLIGFTLIFSFIPIAILLLLHYSSNIPIEQLTKDPVSVGKMPAYTGFLSQVGIFFWAASVTLCFFNASLLWNQSHLHRLKRFFLNAGLLSLLLGLDDAFLLHEAVFPAWGISEKVVLLCYGGLVVFYLFSSSSVIRQTDYSLLGVALFCFGISVAIDGAYRLVGNQYLLEDGAKLIGIVSWLMYFFQVGRVAVDLRRI